MNMPKKTVYILVGDTVAVSLLLIVWMPMSDTQPAAAGPVYAVLFGPARNGR